MDRCHSAAPMPDCGLVLAELAIFAHRAIVPIPRQGWERRRRVGGLTVARTHPNEQLLFRSPSWWTNPQYTDRISHTIVESPPSDLLSLLDLSGRRNAGNVYVYDGTTSNYGMLPSYWDQEVANV